MLRIENHRLVGEGCSFKATPNIGGPLNPRYLVMHYTAGSSMESAVTSLCTQKPSGNASAHLVLGRDGRIVQLAPFNVVTWHAGVSAWNGLTGLNSASIGIEMDNAGVLDKVGDHHVSWFGLTIPDSEVRLAAHRNGGPVRGWHAYTPVQIARATELAELLVSTYHLEDVLGHEDIAPGRKSDPGPAFPLASVRAHAIGREDDALPHRWVTATSLNIRSGPDASAPAVAPALKQGTELLLLEIGSRWSRVEVAGPTDLEGWVNNSFLTDQPPARARSAPPVAKKAAVKKAAAKVAAKKATRSR
ncbi:N-acetylmuramoyl-L-alanine amidase [Leptothrix discophora]|uniref:N-acetylmuramoyl-L-alanine amidase n=1 Tax=Leptothrix discophora TaxID=89 RepID=A0ABT9G4Q0_LEPDI|nr:N-acetylmuramoyl-L-alanine amidase [Leptothrix discophora]MDP4301469.1 N-acetylmuramoyl-L-alanine amidase [Leptothrix discophora]